MLKGMLLQALLLGEGPRADGALERPLTSVSPHVGCHIVLQGKGHGAEVALEWLLSRVNQLVALQVPPARTHVVAHLAPEPPVPQWCRYAREHCSNSRHCHPLSMAAVAIN